MKNNILIVLALLVLGAGAIWFVSQSSQPAASDTEQSMGASTPAPVSDSQGSTENITPDGVREITIEGSEFAFSLSTLAFKVGQPVRLTFKNAGEMPHDWVIDELGVRTKIIESNQEDVIEFTPDKAGTFEYYCSVGKHREMGMKGMLTVE
jgi:plastocyanin